MAFARLRPACEPAAPWLLVGRDTCDGLDGTEQGVNAAHDPLDNALWLDADASLSIRRSCALLWAPVRLC